MKMKREVWAEFADGSVAAYAVDDGELLGLLDRLRDAGAPCTVWIDGRLWKRPEWPEGGDGSGPGEGDAP